MRRLIIQPVNMMDDKVPWNSTWRSRCREGRPGRQGRSRAGARSSTRARFIRFSSTSACRWSSATIAWFPAILPSHGPYAEPTPDAQTAAIEAKDRARVRAVRMAELKTSLAHGGNADDELNNAVIAKDVDRVRYTLSHGAHVDAVDGEGMSPLINAARFGFGDISKVLLEHHADANYADHSHWTPLMYAAWDDDPALIKLLLAHHASMKATDDAGLTPLAIAAQNGKTKSAVALVAAGDDVNAPVAQGNYTPLMLAAISGSGEIVTTLIGRGAQVNTANPGGVTPLMIAAANDHSNIVDLLIRSGADIGARSQDGRTALDIAQAKSNEGMIKMLQDAAQRGNGKSS
jgi:ankyrin repeat protein